MATRPLPRERRDEGEDGRVGEEGGAEPEEEGEHGMGGEEEERAEEDEGEEEESAEEEEEEEMEERVVKRKIVIVVSFGGKGEEGEEQEEEEEGRRSPSPRQDVEVGCQVDGCNADLGEAKRYHRRHKVCEGHAKAAVARVGRVEQRFCQQCSRFHEISQFDGAKRSCRNRLAGHNERRRKVPSDMKADVSKQQVAVP